MRFKKSNLAVLLCILSMAILCFGFAACGGTKDTQKYKVSLNYNSEQGSVALAPAAADNMYEDGSKVTVSVTAKSGYEIENFTVSTDANAKLTDGKYELTVSADATITATFKTTEIPVTSVTLTPDALSLEVGGRDEDATATLVATVLPAEAAEKTVTWTSSDPNIAEVTGGIVTAKAEGDAIITATAGEKSATCTVIVTKHVHTAAANVTYTEKSDGTGHTYPCAECGADVSEEHVYGSYQPTEDNAHHYRLCTKCNAETRPDEHTAPTDPSAYTSEGEEEHSYTCPDCQATVSVAHTLSTKSNGESNHTISCSVCSYSKTEQHLTTYVSDIQNGHHEACSVCDYEAEAKSDHSYQTGFDNDSHWRKCSLCGFGAASAHTLKLAWDAEGHYYICTGTYGATSDQCEYTSKSESHVASQTWSHNADKHWKTCTFADENESCGQRLQEDDHSWTSEGAEEGQERCSVCGETREAGHHLVWESDATQHWQKCTDAGCGYTTPKADHITPVAGSDGWYRGDGTCAGGCGYQMVYTTDGNGRLTGYTGSYEKLAIPEKIGEEGIIAVGKANANSAKIPNIFATGNTKCKNLLQVIIPSSINELGPYLFSNNKTIEAIIFESSRIPEFKARILNGVGANRIISLCFKASKEFVDAAGITSSTLGLSSSATLSIKLYFAANPYPNTDLGSYGAWYYGTDGEIADWPASASISNLQTSRDVIIKKRKTEVNYYDD